MPDWENKVITVDVATKHVMGVIKNKAGTTSFKLHPAHDKASKIIYYTLAQAGSGEGHPPTPLESHLFFPLGIAEVPDKWTFGSEADPGPLSAATAEAYQQAAIGMQGSIEESENNYRLVGQAVSGGNASTVTLYQVQRAAAPRDWYIVVYVHGAGGNPDGGGVGHTK